LTYRQGRFWQPDVTVATVVVRDGRLLVVEELVSGVEETGWEVALTAFIGAYQWTSPRDGRHFLRMAFAGEPVRHHPERPLDEGIVQALWLSPAELAARREQHRSPLVWQVVEDYLAGRRLPLDALIHCP